MREEYEPKEGVSLMERYYAKWHERGVVEHRQAGSEEHNILSAEHGKPWRHTRLHYLAQRWGKN